MRFVKLGLHFCDKAGIAALMLAVVNTFLPANSGECLKKRKTNKQNQGNTCNRNLQNRRQWKISVLINSYITSPSHKLDPSSRAPLGQESVPTLLRLLLGDSQLLTSNIFTTTLKEGGTGTWVDTFPQHLSSSWCMHQVLHFAGSQWKKTGENEGRSPDNSTSLSPHIRHLRENDWRKDTLSQYVLW